MTRPIPRPGIEEISPYVPGSAKSSYSGPVYKLASNESALGPSPTAMAAYDEVSKNLHLYPDGDAGALRAAIGGLYGLESAQIVCGAGSDELISLLCRAYLGPEDTIVQSRYGFSMYHIYAKTCGAGTHLAEEKELTSDVDALLAAVADNTRIVFLANPNNPTGTAISAKEVVRLRDNLRDDILLVLDSAYAEFMTWSEYQAGDALVRASVENGHENVVMLRTFSKIYGLGGIRLGWGYFPPSIAAVLNKMRSPFNLNAPAIAAGTAAIGDQEFLQRNMAHNAQEREKARAAISAHGFSVVPSHTNFLLVQTRGDSLAKRAKESSDLLSFFEQNGIIVRPMGPYFLPDYLRISIGSVDANAAMLRVLGNFVTR